MRAWVLVLVACLTACGGDGESDKDDGSGDGVSESTFSKDDTFLGVVCPAFEEVCACNADRTSCPGNAAAIELYSCLWYAADFGSDGVRSGLSEGLREIEGTDEHLCRTLKTPGQACREKMGTAFGRSDEPYRSHIWEFLDPKPTDSAALIEACSHVSP